MPAVFSTSRPANAEPTIKSVPTHLSVVDGPYISLCYDKGYKENDVDLELCLAVSDTAVVDETRLPAGIRLRTLPAAPRVVSVSYVGRLENLRLVYENLFRWIEQQNLEIAVPCREIYVDNDPDASHAKSYAMEIQQPVV